MKRVLVLFDRDLRTQDQAAWAHAAQLGAVLPLYLLDPSLNAPKGAQRLWLHHSLQALQASLHGQLMTLRGDRCALVRKMVELEGIEHVVWNRGYEPSVRKADEAMLGMLKELGVVAHLCSSSLLWEPWEVLNQAGQPYQVFTPFFRKGCLMAEPPHRPRPAPTQWEAWRPVHFESEDLQLTSGHPWEEGVLASWASGELGAHRRWQEFLAHEISGYALGRNLPGSSHVSRMSPYLHFGEISPQRLWWDVQDARTAGVVGAKDADVFASEMGWREFSYSLLYHFPSWPHQNFRASFDAFEWKNDPHDFERWKRGQTGYPWIDAGMRQLWQTGYMHNRLRMATASFLVKNLRIDWRLGAEWFEETLFDADLANNRASWQWVFGSGADAAPYFRIFNPVLQGLKFDPQGAFVARFVPELQGMPMPWRMHPWEAPLAMRSGLDYPSPMMDWRLSREEALRMYALCREDAN